MTPREPRTDAASEGSEGVAPAAGTTHPFDDDGDQCCTNCGCGPMHIEFGNESTDICHNCAHQLVDTLSAENLAMREAIWALLDEMDHVNVPSLGVLEHLRAASGPKLSPLPFGKEPA